MEMSYEDILADISNREQTPKAKERVDSDEGASVVDKEASLSEEREEGGMFGEEYLYSEDSDSDADTNTDGDDMMLERGSPDSQVLTEDERALLISSWELIQDRVSIIGVSAYNELFKLSPQALEFFPKLMGHRAANSDESGAEQMENEAKFQEVLKDHSIRILGVIGLVIRNLGKIKSADPKEYYSFYKFSFQLGEKHFRYGANPKLMCLLGDAFANSMKQTVLEMDNSDEVEQAWKSFFSVVTSWMKRGFLYVQNKGRELDVYKIPLQDVLQS